MNQLPHDGVCEMLRVVAAANETREDAWALPAEAGAYLHALILASGATRGLELGTSYGYSGLWIGSALQRNGGRLVTIDREARKSALAGEAFAKAGLGECVDARVGTITDVIELLAGPFDFVLIDADKPSSLTYFRQLQAKLTERALVVTDNIIRPEHDWTDFLAHVRHEPGFFSTMTTVGNGMELTVKLPEALPKSEATGGRG